VIEGSEILRYIENANKWDHNINYKESPLFYEVTEDCGGMYTCEPYKTEIIECWKFLNLEVATKSASKILSMFYNYVRDGDFVGADMTRKYLQAGSSRRVIPKDCQDIFHEKYQKVINNLEYKKLKLIFLREKENREG